VSYSIYLIHVPLLTMATIVLKRALHVPSHFDGRRQALELSSPWIGDLAFAAVLAAVLLSSWAAFSFIEEPARLYGRRLIAASPKKAEAGFAQREGEIPPQAV
jgi:peptidoglycan/LPS O-acetylase OafA/YrhL